MKKADKLRKVLSDPKLYIENFMSLPNKDGVIVPFKLNTMQRAINDGMDDYNIILKARQGGGSVFIGALALYYALTTPHTHCLMVSHRIESTRSIFNKLKTIYYTIPDAIKPKLKRNNRQELAFENGSSINCETMGKKDLGRGSSLKLIHISELAFVGDQAKGQLLSLEQALVPSGKIFIESTANGIGNFYHQLYGKAKDGENSYKPFFFNYLDTLEMFKKDHAKQKKIYRNIHGRDLTKDDLTTEELHLLELDSRFNLDILTWRRMKIANSSRDQFAQEFPFDDVEAFVSTGNNVFDSKKILERTRYLPKTINNNKLGDLSSNLKFYLNRTLFIWEKPKPDTRYYIGVDSGEGIGQDYSVIEVVSEEGIQVAEFRHNKLAPHTFAEVCYQIGTYYNTGYMTIEKASSGHSIITKLKYDYKYPNLHKHKDYDARGRAKKKVGFVTNGKTKPIMVDRLRELFEEGQILINSKILLEEMKVFKSKNGKMGAISGQHDDTVMAICLALEGLNTGIWYKG
ncbi:hypothetical protein [Senegalia massiliensis]|uniref:Terminase large subunit gp17-like C-terminal domain-containing protein n=1 Tax=Senegalia massiliensis TaxID=1720316 RepID=A0A845R220_9CLOT|nr:hypothetical protein [Senegalia massiliensis]NBI06623.1 hypothetical protein [Senegalia massiliensis]